MRTFILALVLSLSTAAQVYSPKVLRRGQPDSSDLRKLAAGIYAQAGARTPRERAEAVWRFFLTDGRFVKPGFWYHIAGWAYEEPAGEVLDPLKLLNSYGFGLCYHIAPLLEAVWKAGGFEDARVWFRALRKLGEKHGLPELSMGMSGDFEVAIEEGATLVRVGTAVFGARPPRPQTGPEGR